MSPIIRGGRGRRRREMLHGTDLHGTIPKERLPRDIVAAAGGGGGGGVGTSELLAVVAYNPATKPLINTTSTTPVDIDATNLSITFNVPASGKVLVGLSALAKKTTDSSYHWLLRDTSGNVIPGSFLKVMLVLHWHRPNYRALITGLTPNASLTWLWAHRVGSGQGTITYGDDSAGDGQGPAVMEVWAAP